MPTRPRLRKGKSGQLSWHSDKDRPNCASDLTNLSGVLGGSTLQVVGVGVGPWPARSSAVGSDFGDRPFLQRRLWPRSRFSWSRHDPPDRAGTSNTGSAAKVGAGKSKDRPNSSSERLVSGPNPAGRTPGRPRAGVDLRSVPQCLCGCPPPPPGPPLQAQGSLAGLGSRSARVAVLHRTP